MIRAAAFTILLALAAPATAQTTGALSGRATPTLRQAVTVTSDIVRIGDLVDNAGAVSGIAVFRSPDIGTTGAVPVTQVLEAIRAHDLLLVDTGSLTEIEVTRAGLTIGTKDIESRIARTFAGRQGLGQAKNLVVTLDREARPIQVDPASSIQLQVARAYYDRRLGRFDVTLEIPHTRTAIRYTGTLTETVEVGVLMRSMARGEVLRNSDLAIERRPKSDTGVDLVDALDQAVGLAVRRQLQAGYALRRADLIKPDLVRRDEPVTLVFEVPGITLTMRGKALESGTEGDVVNVLNVQSKRHVQGRVTGSGRITVSSTAPAPARTVAAVTKRSSAE